MHPQLALEREFSRLDDEHTRKTGHEVPEVKEEEPVRRVAHDARDAAPTYFSNRGKRFPHRTTPSSDLVPVTYRG